MKRTWIFVAVFVLFMLAVVNALLLMPPIGYAKSAIVDGVKSATGLDLAVNGKMSLRLVPSVSLRMEDAVVTSPAASGAPVMTARAVEVKADLWPLVRGERNFERVTLIDPKLAVVIDKDGKPVWSEAAPGATRGTQAGPAVKIGTLAISGAMITFRDTRSGLSASLENAEGTVSDFAADRFGEALLKSAAVTVTESSGSTARFAALAATARGFAAGKVAELSVDSGSVQWRNERTKAGATAEGLKARARDVSAEGGSAISIASGALAFRDEAAGLSVETRELASEARSATLAGITDLTFKSGSLAYADTSIAGASLNVAARNVTGTAKSVSPARISGLAAKSSAVTYGDATRGGPAGSMTAGDVTLEAGSIAGTSVADLSFRSGTFAFTEPSRPGAEAGATINAGNLAVTARSVAGGRLADVTVRSGSLDVADAGRLGKGATLAAKDLALDAKSAGEGRLADVVLKSGSLAFADPSRGATGLSVSASDVTAEAKTVADSGLGDVTLRSALIAYAEATRSGGKPTATAREVTASAKSVAPSRITDIAVKSAAVIYGDGTPATGGVTLEGVEAAAPALATGAPVDASVAFVFNKERVSGKARLPSPESLTAGPTLPASLVLAASKGTVDFDGTITPGETPHVKGKTKAATPSLQALAQWLGVTLPPKASGSASFSGDLDAQARRVSLSNGRIEHDKTAMTGSVSVDLTGTRPRVAGNLAADKLDADTYLNLAAPTRSAPTRSPGAAPEVVTTTPLPVKEALKAYFKAMLEQPVRRGGGIDVEVPLAEMARTRTRSTARAAEQFEWSEEKIDVSLLKSVDLDLDLAVKSLTVRGTELSVPRLKTVLKDGALQIDGTNIATKGGRITGKAEVDARQAIPHISTNFKAEGVEVYDLMETLGLTAMLAGPSSVEASLTGSGASQKDIVKTLSGTVRARMQRGEIVGYDFGSVMSWLFGSRQYDPRNRTPFSRLDANVAIDSGVARESKLDLDGPVVGANGDGTIKLIEQEIDYRARLRLSALTLFRNLAVRVFGDWSQPSFAPDLDIFSRSPTTVSSPADALAGADLADPELAGLIGKVLERAGPRGLDPAVASAYRSIQLKAEGR